MKLRARIAKSPFSMAVKILILPLIAGAVVGAESLKNWNETTANSADDEALQDTLRSHFIRMEEGNKFGGVITGIEASSGRSVGIAGLKVFLVQKSKAVKQTVTDSNGSFEMADITPGTYSFCVAGRNGFLAYGVHMIEPSPEASSDEVVDWDLGKEKLEINTSWPLAPVQITASVVPPEFRALKQIMHNMLPSSVEGSVGSGEDKMRINVEKSVVKGGHKINLTPDGELKGRVAPIETDDGKPIRLQDMNVFLIQDDEIYTRATVEEDGRFEMVDVEPGVYGFAAAGKDGFAAISFQAVVGPAPAELDAKLSEDGAVYASAPVNAFEANTLRIALCPSEDSNFLKDLIDDLVDDPPIGLGPDPFVGPGFGGPGFGGPGGPGGFPGGNRLLRWGAIGAIIWAALESGDDPITPPGPNSPNN